MPVWEWVGLQLPLRYSECMLFFLCEHDVCLWEEFPKSCKINQPWSQLNKNTCTYVHMYTTLPGGPFAAFPLLLLCRHMMNGLTGRPAHGLWHMLTFTVAWPTIAVIYTQLHTRIHTFGAADLYKPTPTWTVLELIAHSLVSGLTPRFLVTGRTLRQHSWLLELLLCVIFMLTHGSVRRHANIHTVCFNWYCERRAVAFAVSTVIAMQTGAGRR